jgi:outer membrane receptor protein involved in Fe transport
MFSALAFATVSAKGQGIITGSVTGLVEDPTGAVVAGAKIVATEASTGIAQSATSTNKGEFLFSTLPIGTYKLEITAPGFDTLTLSNVQVSTGTATGLGVEKLKLGNATEAVEVSTSQNLLETVQSQVTTTFDSAQIENLPTGGGFDELALLIPGDVSTHGNNRSNTNGAGISSNGQRGRNNNFEIDGQSNNDNSVAGPQVFMSNPDAIQEIQIVTNNYSAQYGRDAGSVVNYVTKSGTNKIHGSALYFYEGAFFSSLTNGQKNPLFGYCTPGQAVGNNGCVGVRKPRFTDNDYGGTLGGPILKDKLFAFGSAYFARNFSGLSTSNTTTYFPTPASLTQLQTTYPNNPGIQSLVAYSPYAVTLGNPAPLPTGTHTAVVTDGTTASTITFAQYGRTISSYSTDKEILGRMDYQATNRDRFFARFFYQLNPSIAGSGTISTGGFVNVGDITYSIGSDWTHTFTASLVNQVRYSFQQATIKFDGGGFASCTISNLTGCPSSFSLGSMTDVTGAKFSLSGFGLGTTYPQGRVVKDTQFQDNLTYTKGKHSMTMGGGYEFQNSPNVFLPNISGAFTFSSGINSLLTGTGTLGLAAGSANIHFEENDIGLYFQDDWRISPTFTANLGLRWELFGQPINLLHEISVANQTSATPIWSTALPTSVTEFPYVPEDYKNFQPRIGFAWNPTPKLVVRGGYAINYSPAYYNIGLNSYGSAPVLVSASVTGTSNATKPVLPTGGANYTSVHAFDNHYLLGNGLNPGSYNQTLVAPNFHQPKTQTYTLGTQYQIGRYAVAEVRYVGAHTAGDFQSVNANPNIAAAIKAFPSQFPGVTYCTDATQVGYQHISCAATNVRSRLNTSFEVYNGLQTSLTSRNYHGLTATLGYTWSRTIDNASEIFGTAGAGTTVAFSQNPLNTNTAERGLSGNSYPNVTSLGLTYIVPFLKNEHNLKATLLGGFQVNTIYLFNSGQPYTPEQAYYDGSYCDINFGTAFIGTPDACRPILSNKAANPTTVGINVGGGVYQNFATGANGARSSFHWLVNNQAEANALGNPFPGVGRNTLVGNTFNNADISVFKNNKITERINLQLQFIAYNALNRAYYGTPDAYIDDVGSSFGLLSYNGGSNRNIQIGGKVQF